MFAQLHQPKNLPSEEFDSYLERGWFRMGQTIFTTNFLHFGNGFYSAIWLRVKLDEFLEDSTQAKLFKRNAGFRMLIGPATITAEKEELYTRYKKPLEFEPSSSLNHLLYGNETGATVYNTYEIALYDRDRLIGLGLFDLGAGSAAGITSVYDPAYKKFSIGKYLIYRKMDYCKKLKLDYFYPGYFVPGYSSFDYKLTIAKQALQFLQLGTKHWLPIENFGQASVPFNVMQEKLAALRRLLADAELPSKVVKYEFFDANLVPELKDFELLDFPLMLFCPYPPRDNLNLIVFDVSDSQYHLFNCFSVWMPNAPNADPEIFSEHVLKVKGEILAAKTDREMAERVIKFINP